MDSRQVNRRRLFPWATVVVRDREMAGSNYAIEAMQVIGRRRACVEKILTNQKIRFAVSRAEKDSGLGPKNASTGSNSCRLLDTRSAVRKIRTGAALLSCFAEAGKLSGRPKVLPSGSRDADVSCPRRLSARDRRMSASTAQARTLICARNSLQVDPDLAEGVSSMCPDAPGRFKATRRELPIRRAAVKFCHYSLHRSLTRTES
jgi:hypothetical protein